MTTSASPRRIVSAASPMAVVPVEQAEAGAMFGPIAPVRMAMCPEAASGSRCEMRKGLTRRAPRSTNTCSCSKSIP
jgi:hypothetical protein